MRTKKKQNKSYSARNIKMYQDISDEETSEQSTQMQQQIVLSEESDEDEQFTFQQSNHFIQLAKGNQKSSKQQSSAPNLHQRNFLQRRFTADETELDEQYNHNLELVRVQEKLKRKQDKHKTVKQSRDYFMEQLKIEKNKSKQLQEFKSKAICLEKNNLKLRNEIDQLRQQNSKIPEYHDETQKLTQEIRYLKQEVDILSGRNIEMLSLGQSLELLGQVTQTLNKVQQQIRFKSDALLALSKCVVCLTHDRTDLLVPCGHFALCEICAQTVTTCPICRSCITNRVKVHVAQKFFTVPQNMDTSPDLKDSWQEIPSQSAFLEYKTNKQLKLPQFDFKNTEALQAPFKTRTEQARSSSLTQGVHRSLPQPPFPLNISNFYKVDANPFPHWEENSGKKCDLHYHRGDTAVKMLLKKRFPKMSFNSSVAPRLNLKSKQSLFGYSVTNYNDLGDTVKIPRPRDQAYSPQSSVIKKGYLLPTESCLDKKRELIQSDKLQRRKKFSYCNPSEAKGYCKRQNDGFSGCDYEAERFIKFEEHKEKMKRLKGKRFNYSYHSQVLDDKKLFMNSNNSIEMFSSRQSST